jgi:carbon storage regulator
MLLLTRKPGEFIQIGDNIRIHFFSINGRQMKIGIEAPRDVNVMRSELLESRRDDDEYHNR